MVRVRIAPSPTGIPHIGNTRTALFNYLFAKNRGGKFILRIEDTDQKRTVDGAQEAILEIFDWLGMKPDEAYKQSERLDEYEKHIQILLEKGVAYKDEGAVKIKIPKERKFEWTDLIGNKSISFSSDAVEDFVAMKSDGFPTYHFASVVDDHLMEITHVIRGDEWISSAPKHLFLYESFGWEAPQFAHLPVILGSDKTKLSKRHGAKSALDYREEGYLKEALINFMALLGWNPGDDREIMSMDELIKLFDLKDVNTGSPIFDVRKLDWMNGEYIRNQSKKDLKNQLVKFYEKDRSMDNIFGNSNIDAIIFLASERMSRLSDFKELVVKANFPSDNKEVAVEAESKLSGLDEKSWNKDNIFKIFKEIMVEKNIKMPIFYEIFMGKKHGLPLPDFLAFLGKEESLKRIW